MKTNTRRRKKKIDLVEYAKEIEEHGYCIITSIREFKNTIDKNIFIIYNTTIK